MYCNFIGPMFCAAKVLQSGNHRKLLETAVGDIINETLVWENTERPDPSQRRALNQLLEVCYYSPDVLKHTDTEDGGGLRNEMDLRHQEGFFFDDHVHRRHLPQCNEASWPEPPVL